MKRDWHGQENIRNVPADGGMILATNHLSYADVLASVPVHRPVGPLPGVPGQVVAVRRQGARAADARLGQLPVYRGQADAALVLRDAEQGLRTGRVHHLLPGGDRHPRPGPVADGGQDRRGQARPGHRRAGDPGRALGRAGHPAVRERQPAPVAPHHRADAGRPAGRPVRLRGPAAEPRRCCGRPPP